MGSCKNYLAIALIPYAFVSSASAFDAYRIDGQTIEFFTKQKEKITLSKNCYPELKCQAASALKSLKNKSQFVHRMGNPGAQICQSILRGESVIGLDRKNNQNSFCRFPDGSYLDNGSIYYYWVRSKN